MHRERGKETRQKEEEVGRQHQGMDRPGVRKVPEGSGEKGKMEKTGCEIICGAPTTLTVKGWMMMIIMHKHLILKMQLSCYLSLCVCVCVCVCVFRLTFLIVVAYEIKSAS